MALAIGWTIVAPEYTRGLAAVAGGFVPSVVALEPEGTEIVVRYTAPTVFPRSWTALNALTLQGGVVLLAALVAATPRVTLARRGVGVLGVTAVLFVAHVVMVSLYGWAFFWTVTGAGSFTVRSMAAVEPLTYVALPGLLGGAWCWRFWLPRLRPAAGRATTKDA